MGLRACTKCGFPVRVKEQVPDPNEAGRVMHRDECPKGLDGKPDPHKGKKYVGFQRQQQAFNMRMLILGELNVLRDNIERGDLGTTSSLTAVSNIERHTAELRSVVECAVESRKDEG